MKELIEYIAKSLVNEPDEVVVTDATNGGRRVINLQVAPGDMGKVIGKQGRIAHAMRTLLKVASARSNTVPAVLVIADSGKQDDQAGFPEGDEDEDTSSD